MSKTKSKQKSPAVLLYINDLEGGTRHMSDEEFGCYMRLLMAQFNRGGKLPDNPAFLSRFSDSFEKSWPIVKEKFLPVEGEPGLIQNPRMETERKRRIRFVESRHTNKTGANQYSIPDEGREGGHTTSDMTGRMGNGNGNGNVDGNLHGYNLHFNLEMFKKSWPSFFKDPDFSKAWDGYMAMMAKKEKPITDYSAGVVMNKIIAYSDGTPSMAKELLDQSSVGGYPQIYRLKVDKDVSRETSRSKKTVVDKYKEESQKIARE